MKQLSSQDSQFLYIENDRNLSNVVLGCIYAPPARTRETSLYDQLKSHVESRLHTSPIFRRKLVRVPLDLDFPYWADDEFFELDEHLYSHVLSRQNRWQGFCELMGRIHSRPLDMNRPLWEMHLVENLGGARDLAEGSFAVITKLHHAAVDGTTTMRFFGGLSDRDAEGTPLLDIAETAAGAGEAPEAGEIWRRMLWSQIQSPLKMTRSLLRCTSIAAPAALHALADRQNRDRSPVPPTRFNRRISPRKNFEGVEFPLQDFKLIQRCVEGAKINDVVLSVCGGALRRYLDRHGELPAETLVGWVPINMRQKGDTADEEGGNQVTAMTTALCTHLDDPVERLEQITRETRLGKSGKAGVPIRVVADISRSMPGLAVPLVSRVLANSGAAAGLCNVAISNVPGSPEPLYLGGARCVHQFGMTPLGEGVGLFVIALSYDGRLSLSLVSTADIVPDMAFLRECMEASAAELGRAARARLEPKGRRTGAAGRQKRKRSPGSSGRRAS